ncbi:MAG: DUF368 domain-containing protein [Gammaproteobacteria bacterium]|nr:DUF368 domain-containing protein [Gammaproteobacteria bacterium]
MNQSTVNGSWIRATLVNAAKGFLMGAADVVPGVSGGTMALVLGIYRRLVDAIRAFDARLLALLRTARFGAAAGHVDLWFLIQLGAGIASGLLFFTRVVPLPELIQTQPVPIYSLFFGLISASVVVLLRSLGRIRLREGFALALGCVAGFGVVNLVPTTTPDAAWFVFISGALAICAMILPGISGSFVLLILNKYAYVFDAIGRLDVAILLPFGLGAVTGLMLFSRLLSWLLNRFYRPTINVIIGLLLGSLWVIWPFQTRPGQAAGGEPGIIRSTPYLPDPLQTEVLVAAACALAGLGFVLALERLAGALGPR